MSSSGGSAAANARQRLLDLRDDVEGGRVAGLLNRQQRRALSVDADDVRLRRIAVAHVRDVAHVDRRRAHGLDRQVVQLGDRLRAAVDVDVVLGRPDLLRAGRQNQVLLADGVDDVVRHQVQRLERDGIEVDLHLRLLAAVGIRNLRALNARQLRAEEIDAEVEQLLLRQLLTREGELQDRHGGRVEREDERRLRAGRQLAQLRLRDGSHLRDREIDLRAGLKEDLDDRDAAQRLRFDVLDVVDRGRQRALVNRDDAGGHFVGREAAVIPHHRDDGDVDVGEDVSRRPRDGERAHHQNQQSQNDEGIRAA